MKLTNEVLEGMILEELERLGEKKIKIPVAVDTTDLEKLRTSIGAPNAIKGTTPNKKGTLSNWKKFVGLDGNADELNWDDFLAAFSGSDADMKLLASFLGKGEYYDADKVAIALMDKYKDVMKGDAKDLNLGKNPSAQEIIKQFKKYAIDTTRQQGVGGVELPYRAATSDKNWIDGTNLKTSKALPEASVAVFKKGLQDADGDIVKYFDNLAKLGSALALTAGVSKAGDADKLGASKYFANQADAQAHLNGMKPDELFNTAAIVKTLGILAKEVQGASAGTIFETFIALMSGGAVFGGSGGAADIIAGDKGERKFSAKQHQGKPSGSQSALNFIDELGKKPGTKMWYIAMAKLGEKPSGQNTITDFSTLAIYLSGIQFVGELDQATAKPKPEDLRNPEKYMCFVLNEDGATTANIGPLKGKKIPANKDGTGTQWSIQYAGKPDVIIPISTVWADKESIASFDKMFVGAINKVGDAVKTAIKDMNIMLQRLSDKTKVYIADKDPTAAKSVGDDYKNLKDNILGGIGKIGSAQQQTAFKTKADLKENEKLTEEILDKLIKAVIL